MNASTKLLEPNRVWSVGVCVEPAGFSINDELSAPRFVLDARKLRTKRGHVHTYADPFLFAWEDALYLFVEQQAVGGNGSIWAYKTSDLIDFSPLGEVLKERYHVSYPFVFRDRDAIYMLPETSANEEVALYRFDEFPGDLRKARVLLEGTYFDSSIIRHKDHLFLFTTSQNGLEIYFTDDLENNGLRPHAQNPITDSPKIARNGGGPVMLNGELYRIAQDGSQGYGKNIHILKTNELSPTSYNEEVVAENYLRPTESWNSKGGHHMSVAEFRGQHVVAVDGMQNDLFINKFLALAHRFR